MPAARTGCGCGPCAVCKRVNFTIFAVLVRPRTVRRVGLLYYYVRLSCLFCLFRYKNWRRNVALTQTDIFDDDDPNRFHNLITRYFVHALFVKKDRYTL